MNSTDYRTFSDMEVINGFTGAVDLSTKNMTVLVEHLTNFELSSQIEGFKEENKQVYFKIGGYWTRAGEPFNPAPQPDDILQDANELTEEELVDKLEYCGLRIFALKNMVIYLKDIPSKKFKRPQSWRFNRWGTHVIKDVGMEHFPVRAVKRTTKFKKHLIDTLKKEKAEWEFARQELAEVQRTSMS